MTPEQIVTARRAGHLGDLLSGTPGPEESTAPRVPQLTPTDLATTTSDQITDARRTGQLAEVLGGQAPIDLGAESHRPQRPW